MGIKAKLTAGGCTIAVVIASFFAQVGEKSKLSQEGLMHILECEDCSLKAYRDIAGVPTIGMGSTKGVTMDMVISNGEAGKRAAKDILDAEMCFRKRVNVDVTQSEYDGWVSFIINKGCGGFSSSTGLRLLNNGKHLEACNAMLMWDKITVNGKKVYSKGVYNRSLKDSKLCAKQL